MKRLRMILACVCAFVFLAVGNANPAFADKTLGPDRAAVSSVNINTADAKELAEVLFNIGEVKAEAIVKYREENGAFTSKAQLQNVKGIGAGTIKKNEALITL